jgi:hypothetical protein
MAGQQARGLVRLAGVETGALAGGFFDGIKPALAVAAAD